MKKQYTILKVERLHVEMESSILAGSITTVPMQVGTVEVQPMEAGFSDSNNNDFKDISFD